MNIRISTLVLTSLLTWVLTWVLMIPSVWAGSFIKTLVYPVSPDLSQNQAAEKALLILQKEAIQETGVLIQQVMKIKKTEYLELSEENIQQLASAITLTRIISQEFDGKELYLTAEIKVDDSSILNSLAHFRSLTLAEEQITELEQALATQQLARESAEQALQAQQIQTEKDRAALRAMKSRLTLLERLNRQQLAEQNRMKRLDTQSDKLKASLGGRINKQQKRFIADVNFYQNAWAHGMTLQDARQYHRFVQKPFFSESDKETLSFNDSHYRDRFAEDRHDIYIIQQAYIDDNMTYLLAVTHKGHSRIKNIYIATEHARNKDNQIKVTSLPLMQSKLGRGGISGTMRY